LYKPDTALDSVFAREFSRLNKALDARLQTQDEELLAKQTIKK
jgi:hypothetical protein